MKISTGSHEALIVGCISGLAAFFSLKVIDQSPYWMSIGISIVIFGIAYSFLHIYRRSISIEDAVLILNDRGAEIRLLKGEIESYQISKMTRYEVKVFLYSGEVMVMPIHGFFSENRIIDIFESLGIGRQQ